MSYDKADQPVAQMLLVVWAASAYGMQQTGQLQIGQGSESAADQAESTKQEAEGRVAAWAG